MSSSTSPTFPLKSDICFFSRDFESNDYYRPRLWVGGVDHYLYLRMEARHLFAVLWRCSAWLYKTCHLCEARGPCGMPRWPDPSRIWARARSQWLRTWSRTEGWAQELDDGKPKHRPVCLIFEMYDRGCWRVAPTVKINNFIISLVHIHVSYQFVSPYDWAQPPLYVEVDWAPSENIVPLPDSWKKTIFMNAVIIWIIL